MFRARRARRGRSSVLAAALTVAAVAVVACVPGPVAPGGPGSGPLPPDALPLPPAVPPMRARVVMDGLTLPTNVEIAADGRLFVAEKAGVIRTAAGPGDPDPVVVADLRDQVRSVADHGLLGMALDPQYPTRPYLYVLHTTDPTGLWGDGCRDPFPGYGQDGCVGGARIARLTLGADHRAVGPPTTVVEDRWCYQFSSHGVGDLGFMHDGTLLASSGEGSAWWDADVGQFGGSGGTPPYVTPANPCGDPPVPVGVRQRVPWAEGGSLRAQDLLTPDDPVSWDGSLVRIDPDTGAAAPDNPLAGQGSADDDAVVAHGMRNPYRFTTRPGTDEVYVGDVGLGAYEEIDRVVPTGDEVPNFGWPCREGPDPSWGTSPADLDLCAAAEEPDAPSRLTDPWFHYSRRNQGAAISGLAFIRPGGPYPAAFDGDLVFSDYSRGAVWSVGLDEDGDAVGPAVPLARSLTAVDLANGPDGYLYAVDIAAGAVVVLEPNDGAPEVRVLADRVDGGPPLTAVFDASTSTSPAGWELTYAWDLDGDGDFDDGTGPTATSTFSDSLDHVVSVRVTDSQGVSATGSITVYPGNLGPTVDLQVDAPPEWSAGGPIGFTVDASDNEDGPLGPSSVEWRVNLHHCASLYDCHVHTEFSGSEGEFAFSAPTHEYPAHLEIVASATDSRGQTTTVRRRLDPATLALEVLSFPAPAEVTVGSHTQQTPFALRVIRGSTLTVTAAAEADFYGLRVFFSSWSNAGGRSHTGTFGEDTRLIAYYGL